MHLVLVDRLGYQEMSGGTVSGLAGCARRGLSGFGRAVRLESDYILA